MKKELTIEDIIPNLSFITGEYGTDSLSKISKNLKNGSLIIDFDVFLPTISKNLQRGFVWTDLQKNEFIHSVFKSHSNKAGKPTFSRISIIEYNIGMNVSKQNPVTWQIIDGKQRISTLLDFIDNKFPFQFLGYSYFYSELSEELKKIIGFFNFSALSARHGIDITEKNKIDWFEFINFTSSPNDLQEFNLLKQLYEKRTNV